MVVLGVPLFDPSAEELVRWGADYGPLTLTGQWWRVPASLFLHAGVFHVALNMWCLFNLGVFVELLFGRVASLLLYFFSGVGGALASLLVHPNGVSVGASGAIFGLAGGTIAALALSRQPAAITTAKGILPSLFGFVGYNLAYGFMSPMIDNAAHVGGLLTGAAFGAALSVGRGATTISRRRLMPVAATFATALLFGARAVRQMTAGRLAEPGAFAAPSLTPAPSRVFDLPESDFAPTPPASPFVPYVSDDSVAGVERAVARMPDSTRLRVELGRLYLQTGRSADALRTLEQATRTTPEDVEAWRLVGTAHFNDRRYDQAITAFERVARLAPGDRAARSDVAYAYLARGSARAANGDVAGAAQDFRRVIEMRVDAELRATARHALEALPAPR
jgi:membrane associated rhomboid family serine protease